MNNFESTHNAMKGASKEELKILTPDRLTPAERIEALRVGGSNWEREYWEDVEQREIDRINRDRLGNLAYKK